MSRRRTFRRANLGPASRWYVPWGALREVAEMIERADAGAVRRGEPEYMRRIREAVEEAREEDES